MQYDQQKLIDNMTPLNYNSTVRLYKSDYTPPYCLYITTSQEPCQ